MGDGEQRLAGVALLLESIYPGARAHLGTEQASRTAADRRVFQVLPSRGRPRLLVPAEVPGVAARALDRGSAIDRRRDVVARRVVAGIAASPLGPRLLRTTIAVGPVDDTSVEAHLAGIVGSPVRLSVLVGAERANAKAVLGVYRTSGVISGLTSGRQSPAARTSASGSQPGDFEAGFCKVGSTALTGRLVRQESTALSRLAVAGLRQLEVPPVLHAGRWRDSELLLIGAVRGSRGGGRGIPYAAMREVAAVGGVTDAALQDSPWVSSVRSRLTGAGPGHADDLRALLDALVRRDGALVIPHGTWHGDWGPWSMAWAGERPVVWDWERCTGGVPVGLDAAHFVGHPPLRRIGETAVGLAALAGPTETEVAHVLEPWVAPPALKTTARCVVDAYVLEIACRFAVDAADTGTAPVERLAGWYLQVAAQRLAVRLDAVGRT